MFLTDLLSRLFYYDMVVCEQKLHIIYFFLEIVTSKHIVSEVLSLYGHVFVDSLLIRHRNSTSKFRRYSIDYERRIHVERITSIKRG